MKSLLMLLNQLGFDEAQSQLYVEISATGPITVLELSRSTGIKRTTVHFHVEQLIARGLVTEGVRRGRRVLMAVSTEKLAQIVESQKQQVVALEKSLERVIKESTEHTGNEHLYGIGFSVEDGAVAVEKVYRDAMEAGDVVSYLDLLRVDGLSDIRTKLFTDVSLRQSVYSFRELYVARDPGMPEYIKKLKAYKPFKFSRTQLKLSGNVVNIIVFDKVVAIIVRDSEWKVIRITQPVVAQLVSGMIDVCFVVKE